MLNKSLENYAEARRSNPAMSMLAEVAEAAMVLAEAQTQPDDLLMAVDKVTDTAGAPASHLSKKMTAETGEDGCAGGMPTKGRCI